MYYEIYIDQMFIENLVILVLLLKTAGKLMRIRVSWKRIWLTCAAGAAVMCAVIFFRPKWGRTAQILFRIVLVLVTAAAGLGYAGLKETCRAAGYLLAAAACSGGIFQIVFSIWEPPVLLAAALAYTAMDILIRMRRNRMVLEEYRAGVALEDQGHRWELTGLIDTGNHLTEPLTGRPVSILDWQEAMKMERFLRIQEEKNGYLYIPYHAVGTENGWMQGMVIDVMYIRYREKEIRIDHPVLAVSSEKLSPDGRYQIILNPVQIDRA